MIYLILNIGMVNMGNFEGCCNENEFICICLNCFKLVNLLEFV